MTGPSARPSLVAILFLGIALAGCLTATDDLATLDDEVVQEVQFTTIETPVTTDRGIGEPSLGVTPDGILFTNAGNNVYRSSDGGATWDDLGNPMTLVNGDPDLVVDPDGRVWYSTLYLGCNEVAVSEDLGETWFVHPAVCGGPVGDRQYIVAPGDGVAYLYFHQLPTFYQTAMKTTDAGRTWTPVGLTEGAQPHHLLVNEGSGWGGGGFFNPVTGSIWFTYTWSKGGLFGDEWVPAASVMTGNDLVWDVVMPAEPTGSRLGLSLVTGDADDAGNVYLTWAERFDDVVHIYVVGSQDDGQSWTEPVRMDSGTNMSRVFPIVEAGADGHVAVAYYEADRGGNPTSVDVETNWTVQLAHTTDFWAEERDIANDQLSRGIVKVGQICPDGTTCTQNREFLDYFALQAMPDGTLAAAFNSKLVEGHEDRTLNVVGITRDAIMVPGDEA